VRVGNGKLGRDDVHCCYADAVEEESDRVGLVACRVEDGVVGVVEVCELFERVAVPGVVERGDERDGLLGGRAVFEWDVFRVFEEPGACVADLFEGEDGLSGGGDGGGRRVG